MSEEDDQYLSNNPETVGEWIQWVHDAFAVLLGLSVLVLWNWIITLYKNGIRSD